MGAMNRGLNLQTIQRIMNDFERESSMMDMKEEMMSETIGDVMDEEEDEEEGDKVLKEVLDELGVSLSQQVRPGGLDSGRMILIHCYSSLMRHLLGLRRQHL
jgi:division protein CdvB (Snf7/Vps24/ESCRT-III family)